MEKTKYSKAYGEYNKRVKIIMDELGFLIYEFAKPETLKYHPLMHYLELCLIDENDPLLIKLGVNPSYIYITRNNSINACAFKQKNNYLIELNYGTINWMAENYLAKPLVADKDIPALSLLKGTFDLPINSIFYHISMNFIFFHEMGHWIQFLGQKKMNITEKVHAVPKGEIIDRHIMEYDADQFAAIKISNISLQYLYINRKNKVNSSDIQLAIIMTCIPIMLLFILFADENKSQIDINNLSHPHPLMRIRAIIPVIINAFQSHLGNDKFSFNIEFLNQCIVDACWKLQKGLFGYEKLGPLVEIDLENNDLIMKHVFQFLDLMEKDNRLSVYKWKKAEGYI